MNVSIPVAASRTAVIQFNVWRWLNESIKLLQVVIEVGLNIMWGNVFRKIRRVSVCGAGCGGSCTGGRIRDVANDKQFANGALRNVDLKLVVLQRDKRKCHFAAEREPCIDGTIEFSEPNGRINACWIGWCIVIIKSIGIFSIVG